MYSAENSAQRKIALSETHNKEWETITSNQILNVCFTTSIFVCTHHKIVVSEFIRAVKINNCPYNAVMSLSEPFGNHTTTYDYLIIYYFN